MRHPMLILRSLSALAVRPQGQDRRERARPRRRHHDSRPPTPTDPADTLRQQNPLGKIPMLDPRGRHALFDSPRDPRISRSSRRRRPDHSEGRDGALRGAAPAGARRRHLDASILLVYEGRWRPAERHEQKWIDHQAGKVARALAALEAEPPALGAVPNVGQITLACALGYHDFRFDGTLAQGPPAARRVARRLRRQRAGVREDQAAAAVLVTGAVGYIIFMIFRGLFRSARNIARRGRTADGAVEQPTLWWWWSGPAYTSSASSSLADTSASSFGSFDSGGFTGGGGDTGGGGASGSW